LVYYGPEERLEKRKSEKRLERRIKIM
jgi:hypothetical protein